MKISIAMATYNGAQFLRAQLDSFVAQTLRPDELVITDDCSSDDTADVVSAFAATAPFAVRFARNTRTLGYCGNFNAALLKTTGDVVFLSDQDDVWFPEKIERVVGEMASHPNALVVMNDAALTDHALNEVGLTKIGQIRSAGSPLEHYVMGCCCAVRRDLLDLCLPISEGFGSHDAWLVWLADGMKRKHVVESVLQWYRRHGANESSALANATRRITPWTAFVHHCRRLRDPELAVTDRRFQQKQMFLSGIERAIQTAQEPYRTELEALHAFTRKELSVRAQRMDARRKHLASRVPAVLHLAARGAYRHPAGGRAAVRDLLGYRSKPS